MAFIFYAIRYDTSNREEKFDDLNVLITINKVPVEILLN